MSTQTMVEVGEGAARSELQRAAIRAGINDEAMLDVIGHAHRLTTSQMEQLFGFLTRNMGARRQGPVTGRPHCCGSPEKRVVPVGQRRDWSASDTWRLRPNGDRCCSFCHSIDAEGLLGVLLEAKDPASPTRIELVMGKPHKVYLHRPSVRNAGDGAIKFYTWHLPQAESELADQIRPAWQEAVLASKDKFSLVLSDLLP